jgi:hypothetical protein
MDDNLILEVLDRTSGKIRNIPLSQLMQSNTIVDIERSGFSIIDQQEVGVSTGTYYINNYELTTPTNILLSPVVGHTEIGIVVNNQIVNLISASDVHIDYCISVNGAIQYGSVSNRGSVIITTPVLVRGSLMSLNMTLSDGGLILVGSIDYDDLMYMAPLTDIVNSPIYVLTVNQLVRTPMLGPLIIDNRALTTPTYISFSDSIFGEVYIPILMTVLTTNQPIIMVNNTGQDLDIDISVGTTTYKSIVPDGGVIPGISSTTPISSMYVDIRGREANDLIRVSGTALVGTTISTSSISLPTTFTGINTIDISPIYSGSILTINNATDTTMRLDPSLNSASSITELSALLNINGNDLIIENGLPVIASISVLVSQGNQSFRYFRIIEPGATTNLGPQVNGSSLTLGIVPGGIAGVLINAVNTPSIGPPSQMFIGSEYTLSNSDNGDNIILTNPSETDSVNIILGPGLIGTTTTVQFSVSSTGQSLLLTNGSGVPVVATLNLIPYPFTLATQGPMSTISIGSLQGLAATATIVGTGGGLQLDAFVLPQTHVIYNVGIVSPSLSDLRRGISVSDPTLIKYVVTIPPTPLSSDLYNMFTYADASFSIVNGTGRTYSVDVADSIGRVYTTILGDGMSLDLPSGGDVTIGIYNNRMYIQVFF